MKHLLRPLLLLLLLPLIRHVLPASPPKESPLTSADEERIASLKRIGYSNPPGSQPFSSAWNGILDIDPRNLEAHVILGDALIASPDPIVKERAMELLESAFDPAKVTPTIDHSFPQTYFLAATIGRYRIHKKEYRKGLEFTSLASKLGERHASSSSSERLCLAMQLGSMFDPFPSSEERADEAIELLTVRADLALLNGTAAGRYEWPINDREVAMFPGASADPFVHCLLSSFSLSFYYRADVAAVARRQYEMAVRGWPSLNYVADFVKRYDRDEEARGTRRQQQQRPCVARKIRLGIISGVMTEGHSNSESFGGTLSRLDRDVFEVTYVLLAEAGADVASFTRANSADRVFVWRKGAEDVDDGTWPVRKWARTIESWELDVLFYTELTMSSWARRLGMARLAPVQVNSIGHPITSGIDKSVVQYYVSWGAAELPIEQSRKHYTETLKLLPPDMIYQYYQRRSLPGEISRMDGLPYGRLTRRDFGLPAKNARLYLCMQKPLKFHPDFDDFVCGITKRDRGGIVALHREDNALSNQAVFEKRLERAGCDMKRLAFLDSQPHHRLLALYRDATVVLDSYPAGGDTTTREVIEMGKALVTLPARLLGGRWSLGYLSNIGLKESTKKALIATSMEEYIELAVTLANDDALRRAVEADMKACAPNLFRRNEAIIAWQEMFLEISPYQQCRTHGMHEEEL